MYPQDQIEVIKRKGKRARRRIIWMINLLLIAAIGG